MTKVERQRMLEETQRIRLELEEFEVASGRLPVIGRRSLSVSDEGDFSQLLMLQ